MTRAAVMVTLMFASAALAQTTRPAAPTTQAAPPGQRSAEQTLRELLQSSPQTAQPIRPTPDQRPQTDVTSGQGAVAPDASLQPLVREGTLLLDRVGRLTRL